MRKYRPPRGSLLARAYERSLGLHQVPLGPLMEPYRRADHDEWPVHKAERVKVDGFWVFGPSGYIHPRNSLNRAQRRSVIREHTSRQERKRWNSPR